MLISTMPYDASLLITKAFTRTHHDKYSRLIVNVTIHYDSDIEFNKQFISWDDLKDVTFMMTTKTEPFNEKYVGVVSGSAYEFFNLLIQLRNRQEKKEFSLEVNLEQHDIEILNELYNLIKLEFSFDEDIKINIK